MIHSLDALESSGLPWALLHGAERIEIGAARSDSDVVVDADLDTIVGELRPPLIARGLAMIMVWPYDLGAASIFVVRRDSPGGAQLDVTFDRVGRSTYGIRAPMIVRSAQREGRWPVASRDDMAIYDAIKGAFKVDRERVQRALTGDNDPLLRRARQVLSSRHAKAFEELSKHGSTDRQLRSRLSALVRLGPRLERPTGAWVHSPSGVDSWLSQSMEDVVPMVRVGPSDPSRLDVLRVMFQRLRPSLVFTEGRLAAGTPDVVLSGVSDYRAMTEGLDSRILRHYG